MARPGRVGASAGRRPFLLAWLDAVQAAVGFVAQDVDVPVRTLPHVANAADLPEQQFLRVNQRLVLDHQAQDTFRTESAG